VIVEVVPPFDHEYVYGPVPPLTTDALAVPLLKAAHVASVDDVEATSIHGAAQPTVGWNPSLGSPPTSVPVVK
jgi:hypothetical protein